MKLAFTRRPAYHGKVHSKRSVSVQFFENDKGIDYLKVTSDSPRQVIEVPVSLIDKALEARWERDSQERAERIAKVVRQELEDHPEI